jgi:hypothetical protein
MTDTARAARGKRTCVRDDGEGADDDLLQDEWSFLAKGRVYPTSAAKVSEF